MDLRIMILAPLFVSLYVIARQSLEKAFLNVYLPVLLCLPPYDELKLPGLPFLTFSEAAILPIAIWLIATRWRSWRLTRMDFWMLLFGISSCATLVMHVSNLDIPLFALFTCLATCIFPYVVGKLLIEQSQLRERAAKRIVFLLALIALFCIYEYRMGTNPLHNFWTKLIPPTGRVSALDHSQYEQFRWGFTRAAGPFTGSELAGMVYIFGTLFAYYLYKNQQWERKFRWPLHPFQKGTLLLLMVSVGMFVTQARGAYMGVALGYVIARIATARNIKKASIYTGLFLVFVAVPSYEAISSYASARSAHVDSDQGDAVYRTLLIQNYVPVMEAGGWFGWGLDFPVVDGQSSIDNAYLYIGLTQGYIGAVSFSLLIVESMLALFIALRTTRTSEDRGFVFCLGGAIAGMALCLGTVFPSSPATELLFLVMGWSQSVRPTVSAAEQAPVTKEPIYRFRRVFT